MHGYFHFMSIECVMQISMATHRGAWRINGRDFARLALCAHVIQVARVQFRLSAVHGDVNNDARVCATAMRAVSAASTSPRILGGDSHWHCALLWQHHRCLHGKLTRSISRLGAHGRYLTHGCGGGRRQFRAVASTLGGAHRAYIVEFCGRAGP